MNAPFSTTLLTAAATLLLAGCNAGHDSASSSQSGPDLPAVSVQTIAVSAETLPQIRHLPGTVQASSRATLAAKIMGSVTRVPAVGQTVVAGDVLAEISAAEISAQVDQARAALDLATRNHRREADLLERGATTAETVRSLDDQRRMAIAQWEAVRAQLSYTQVVAPFAGRVTARRVEVGDLATPGTPLLTLEGSALEVQVAVPESLPVVATGDAVVVELDSGHAVTATVTEASPAADPVTRSRMVRLALPDGVDASAGQFVRVRWSDRTAAVTRIPVRAVTTFGQMQRVFVVSDGRAVLRLVKTGHVQDGTVVVLSGLNPGEAIITNPPANLRDGQAVNL